MKNVAHEGFGASQQSRNGFRRATAFLFVIPEGNLRFAPYTAALNAGSWRTIVLVLLALIGSLLSPRDVAAQCQNTFTAVPLNVQQTYIIVTDPTHTSTFASSPCDPYGKGVYDTYADALLSEQAEEGPIPAGQIIGLTYGNYYVGGTNSAEYIQFTPTSNPGFAYTNIVTYWVKTGLGPISNTITFFVNAAPLPTVTSIATASGPTTGGTSFTITGTNLTAATGVSFGGTAATSYTVNSATSITVTAPAHASGQVDITVTTPNGTSATSSDDQYTFVPAPAITSLTPTSGTTAGGTTVTITGTNLSNTTQILFNGTAGTSISSTATSATVTTPAHAAGQVDVTLTTVGGTTALVAGDHYTFVSPPTASASSATIAYNSSANAITLNISGGPTSVTVASQATHGIATASGTSIAYTPTAGYFGSDSFTYTATNAVGTSSAATVNITVSSPPITVSPTTLTSGTFGTAYSQTLSATGGQAPYTFSTTVASGALPTGLSLSSTGAITGTPTAAGTFTFTVSGTDSSTTTHANFTSTTISLTIAPIAPGTPTIGTATSGNLSASVAFTPPASNGGASITSYTVTSSPGGITATGSTSPITVTGLTNGTSYTFTVTATNSAGTSSASSPSNSVTPTGSPIAMATSATVAYNSSATAVTLNLSGGTPTSVAVASAASHGTATASGTTITYTPVTGFFGTDSFTYTATNGFGTSSAAIATVTVTAPTIAVTPTMLPTGVALGIYSQQLTATGGKAPYTFSTTLASGALPIGFTLSTTGVVSGTTLIAGTYTFTVTGTDSSTLTHATFTSTPITLVVNATIPLAPGIPTIGAATAGNQQATVSFGPPISDGGAAITSYTVTSNPTGITATGTGSPITVTGLTNGVAYTFSVTATNSVGTSLPSLPSNSVTPIAAPIAGATSAAVAYDSTANSIALNLTGGAPTSVAVVAQATHGTATASGTTIIYAPTTGYYGTDAFTFNATNSTGTSATATATITINGPVITVTPATLTSDTVGSAYSQSLTASGGQAPYAFSATVASGALPLGTALMSNGAITGTPTTAGTYTFTVTGTDSSAPTHASFTSSTISLTISAVLAGAPTIGTATAGDSQATVSFTPPASTGGSPITSFTVTSSPGGITASGSASPITVTGLTDSTSYTFTVTATNAAGVSSASAASNAVTPVATPIAGTAGLTVAYNSTANAVTLNLTGGAPTSVAVASQASHGTATATGTNVAYTPSTGFFGTDTFTYTATNATGTSSPATVAVTVSAPTISVTPTTLPSGTDGSFYAQTITTSGGQAPYTFSTTPVGGALPTGLSMATTGVISGTPTSAGTFTFTVSGTDSSIPTHATFTSSALTLLIAAVAPGAPTSVIAASGQNGQASVSFTAPASTGGASITSYTVTSVPGGITATSAASPITIAALTNGTPYTFLVTATNSAGTGPSSSPSNSVTTQANQTITFPNPGSASFSTPLTLAATASSALSVSYASSTPSVCTINADTGVVTFVAAGTCTIAANQPGNTVYLAAAQVSVSFSVTAVPPGTPLIISATAGNGQSVVTFTPPLVIGGAPITSYTVTSNPGGITATGTGSPITVSPLANGTSYTFTVTATNSAGTGPSSAPSGSVVPSALVTATQAVGSETLTQNHAATAFTPVVGGSGAAPLTYTVAPTLPAGLSLSSATGAITGTPTTASSAATYTVTVTDANNVTATANFSLTINGPVTATTGSAPPTATVGVTVAPFTPITGSGGTAPFAYTVSPALPATLTMNPVTGQITGTPAAASAATSYVVTVTDANGATAAATFSLTINAPLVAGPKSVIVAYNSNGITSTTIDLTSSITGGTPTSVSVSTAPAHGTATASGLSVTYTPTQGFYGSDSFTYTAAAGSLISSIGTVSITIPAPVIAAASDTLPGGAVNIAYSHTIVPTGGAAPYIFSTTVSSGAIPAGLTISSAGVLFGTPITACTCTFTLSGTDSSTGPGPVTFSLTLSLTIVAGAPTVTAVTPDLGLAAGGISTTITGTNFTDTSIVSFGSVPATSVTYINATTLMVTIPASTAIHGDAVRPKDSGSSESVVDVTVTTAGGTSFISPADQFTYLAQAGALSNPLGTTVDGSGNTFIADPTLGYIVEVPGGCTSISCEKIIGSGLTGLTGVTVDSNGDLIALSGGASGTVTEFTYDATTGTYGQQTTVAAGLNLPTTTPSGVTVDDTGDIYLTDTADHTIVEEPYNPATGTYGSPVTLTTGLAQSTPTGITVDANGDVFYADPGTIDELIPGSTTPIVLASGVNAQSVALDASGNLYYTDSAAGTVTKLPAQSPFDGTVFGAPVVLAIGLSTPYGLTVDDSGNLLVANNGTQSLAKVTLDTPPSFTFVSTKSGATSTDSPHTATLANIGTADLTLPPASGVVAFISPATSATNPSLPSGYVFNSATTCPQLSITSSAQAVAQGASCTYAVSFSPAEANLGSDAGALTLTDDNLNVTSATQSISVTSTALADDSSTVTVTLNPASPIVFGKSVAITAAVSDITFPTTIPTGSVNFTAANGSSPTPISTIALTAGSATVPAFKPSAAGTYTLAASYTGAVGDIAASSSAISLVVDKATPTLIYSPAVATAVYGTPIPASALNAAAADTTGVAIPGTFIYTATVNSATITLVGGTTIIPAGTYAITATFTPADTADYTSSGTITATYTVTEQTATITLGNLSQSYNGQPHSASVTTAPANLTVAVTYNDSATPPTAGGSYTVVATIHDADFSGTATGTLVIAKVAAASVTLVATPNPVLTTTPVTLTATVISPLATPTGSVNFVETASGTVFATAPLVNGVATFNTSAEPIGVYNLVADYLGDTNFLPLESPVYVSTVLDFSVTIATVDGTSTTATADPGGTADYSFSLFPDGSPTFTDPVIFSISGQPAGSTYTITPPMIPAGSGPMNVALSIQLPQQMSMFRRDGRNLAPFALALLLLPFAGRLRRSGRRIARAFALLVLVTFGIGATTGLSSCGTNSGFSGGSPSGPKTYTITLTGKSGALTHSTTVILIVP